MQNTEFSCSGTQVHTEPKTGAHGTNKRCLYCLSHWARLTTNNSIQTSSRGGARPSPPLPPHRRNATLLFFEQINDFLEQHINKLRYDRFEQAVQQSFEAVKPNHESWIGAKEEAGSFLRQWYRTTHGVNSFSNAEVGSGGSRRGGGGSEVGGGDGGGGVLGTCFVLVRC